MAYKLGDIYIGDYPMTQAFGARPDIYSARYNLRGHNGTDFKTPSLTPILSAANGVVLDIGFDAAGYGNFVKILHDGFYTMYGHLNDYIVKVGDQLISGQLLGHSNNTGFSDEPHLHFSVAPCDASGKKTQPENGFGGYIDPMGPECSWDIKNINAPIVPGQTAEDIKIELFEKEYSELKRIENEYSMIVRWLDTKGLKNYLVQQETNLQASSIVQFIMDLIPKEIESADYNNSRQSVSFISSLVPKIKSRPTSGQTQKIIKKKPFWREILGKLRGFIFVK